MAEKKFFVDINLQGSALTNATIGTNSSLTKAGSFGFDGTRLKYFDGTAIKDVANLSDIAAVTGGLIFQGGYDPTTDTPDITDGTALKGYFWAATAAGTFLGESVQVGDSIVAKVDNAGATLSDWLILQGNIVIATDSVDGISRLATQTEANDGTEGGAVVITPATLQGKIDAQITPEISSKLPLAGGTMTGTLNMGGSDIQSVSFITGEGANKINLATGAIINAGDLDANFNKITNVPAPTSTGDATNKEYVDNAASTAQANAEAYADSLAPNYDAAGSAAQALTDANSYTDTGLAAKLDLAGGTMSGQIDMAEHQIYNVSVLTANDFYTNGIASKAIGGEVYLQSPFNANNVSPIINLPAPTADGDAANKLYVDTTAATAESNANAYTDSKSTAVFVNTEDWILDGTTYIYTIQNTLNGNLIINTVCGNRPAEFEFYDSNGTIYLYSNVLPTEQVRVNIMEVSQ